MTISRADIRRLDLKLLKTLAALLDEGSVTRAAARLGLTQPAVSGMLTRLRESFDDPLFVRGQHGMIPTRRAQDLAEPLKRVLVEIETLLHPPDFDPASAEVTLHIAATDYALQTVVVPFVSVLTARAPNIRIAIHPLDEAAVPGQLERGELDWALLTPETTPSGLRFRPLFEEVYVCAMRADHPAAQAESLSLDRFCMLKHALASYAGPQFRGVTDAALARIGRQRQVVLSVPSFFVLIETLRTTDLITVAPRRLVASAASLRLFSLPVEVPGFSKSLVWHERTHRDPGHHWLRTLMVETCGTPDSWTFGKSS
mgnify:CR=1 FL=1